MKCGLIHFEPLHWICERFELMMISNNFEENNRKSRNNWSISRANGIGHKLASEFSDALSHLLVYIIEWPLAIVVNLNVLKFRWKCVRFVRIGFFFLSGIKRWVLSIKVGYLTKKGLFELEIWESIHTGFHIHHFRFNIIISPFSLFFHFIFYSSLFSPYSWDSSLNFRDIYVLPLASIEEDRFDYRVVVWWNCIPFWQSRVRGYQIQIEFVSWYFYL